MSTDLWIYDTFTGNKERFQPRQPGQVRMYVCGMTVYDFCHLGHARAYTAFDSIVRFLRFLSYEVTYVRNITDIDDKIIQRARETIPAYEADPQKACRDLAERFTEAFHEDMARLDLVVPDIEPKATEHLDGIIRLIQKLLDKGFAYLTGNGVYFDVTAFKAYGKLSKRDPEDIETQSRIETDPHKRRPLDFALWKHAVNGEPAFESPFGPGRPGWHIECSAMSMQYLGTSLDIHGGGRDLIFPHHENELAQSEAATGKPFVNVWMHNGFITLQQEKMSKSLGNFKTLRDCLEQYPANLLKYYFLSTHYRSPLEFSGEKIEGCREGLRRLENTLTEASLWLQSKGRALPGESVEVPEKFLEAMCDDFNTPKALGTLHNTCTRLNTVMKENPVLLEAVHQGFAEVRAMLDVLGLTLPVLRVYTIPSTEWSDAGPEIYALLDGDTGTAGPGQAQIPDNLTIRALVQLRGFAKSQKNFSLADRIREYLAAIGVELRDQVGSCTYRIPPRPPVTP